MSKQEIKDDIVMLAISIDWHEIDISIKAAMTFLSLIGDAPCRSLEDLKDLASVVSNSLYESFEQLAMVEDLVDLFDEV